MYEDVKVPPEVQARVDYGWGWFIVVTTQEMRDRIDPTKLAMDSISEDVIALAFDSDDSDEIMRKLGISHDEAERLGLVAHDDADDEDEYYEQLTAAWYRKLRDAKSVSLDSVVDADAAGLLAMIEGMGR